MERRSDFEPAVYYQKDDNGVLDGYNHPNCSARINFECISKAGISGGTLNCRDVDGCFLNNQRMKGCDAYVESGNCEDTGEGPGWLSRIIRR